MRKGVVQFIEPKLIEILMLVGVPFLSKRARIKPQIISKLREPEELFETISQALLSSVDRDCLSGWGGQDSLVLGWRKCIKTASIYCFLMMMLGCTLGQLEHSLLKWKKIMSKARAMISISREEDLELERQLKILNKPPIKTIQTKVGDIIDCIDINKQPALDHPLLKNHKVQLRPNSFPAMASMSKISPGAKSLRLRSTREACPSGTVPIKRTSKEDLVRVRSLSIPNIGLQASYPNDQHIAAIRMTEDMTYYGASGSVSVYNVSVTQDQTSSANIWIQSGPPEEISVITAGWMVSPTVNGDGLTRLFSYWTGGGTNKTGCFNALCPGFVQTNKEITLDQDLSPTSTYGGDQYEFKYLIYQDRQTGNWWYVVSEDSVVVGYWPKEIFSHLNDGAMLVAYGGFTKAGNDGISPPMGNGHMPDGYYKHACYFRQVHFINENKSSIPAYDRGVEYLDSPACYGLSNDKTEGRPKMDYIFTFGGPGCKCGAL